MTKKYYYIIYKILGLNCTQSALINVHPLVWRENNYIEDGDNIYLKWWKQIPKKVFDECGGLGND